MSTRFRPRRTLRALVLPTVVLLVAFGLPGRASAQEWPTTSLTVLDGRVTFGGDITISAGSEDTGYFNYTDYDRSALRLGRLDLVTTARASERLSFVLELRAEGDLWEGHWTGSPYAAFVRVRPWIARPIVIEAGRVPTAFGAFMDHAYGTDNPLIGYPLAYQYLTSLRPDAVPADADELLAGRGRGWLIGYSVGEQSLEAGVSLVSAFRYDTGVRVRVGSPRSLFDVSASVTTGTLSYPGLRDGNGMPQVSGRVVVRPVVGLVLGASASRGAFVAKQVRDVLPERIADRRYPQRAFGADAEYSRDHWLIRTEAIASTWTLPSIDAPRFGDLPARSWLAEGRYTILPQLYAAARYDRLWFGTVAGTTARDTWDANVERLEVGGGYRLTRTATLKGSVQRASRDGGRIPHDVLGAVQVVLWF
jgi:hypothetical protein